MGSERPESLVGTRNLRLSLPTEHAQDGEPCTPTYEFPVTLRPQDTSTPDMSGLSLGGALTPSPPATRKSGPDNPSRSPEGNQWSPTKVKLLQNVLARPPKEAMYAPGSMPPPQVLDLLTSAIIRQCGSGADVKATEDPEDTDSAPSKVDLPFDRYLQEEWNDIGYEASAEPSPSASEAGSRESSPFRSAATQWPHSWDETRKMLTSLALAETRLGHAREERKLTREERLARPGMKRVTSMDFLDDPSSDLQPSDKIGRVLRLSTQLQNSTREGVAVTRAASLGAPTGSMPMALSTPARGSASAPRSTPPVAFNTRPFARSPPPRPSLMRRQSSGRSDRSARGPSLLARGRSFTASDLEAEVEAEMRQVASEPISNAVSALGLSDTDISPMTPVTALPDVDSTEPIAISSTRTSPRRYSSAPDIPSTRLHRSLSYSAASRREPRPESRMTSQDFSGPSRSTIGLGLPSAPVHAAHMGLGPAFDATSPPALGTANDDWDSDSGKPTACVKRRPPHLALTAMTGSAADTATAGTGTSPKITIDDAMSRAAVEAYGGEGGLRSPFEERPMPL